MKDLINFRPNWELIIFLVTSLSLRCLRRHQCWKSHLIFLYLFIYNILFNVYVENIWILKITIRGNFFNHCRLRAGRGKIPPWDGRHEGIKLKYYSLRGHTWAPCRQFSVAHAFSAENQSCCSWTPQNLLNCIWRHFEPRKIMEK